MYWYSKKEYHMDLANTEKRINMSNIKKQNKLLWSSWELYMLLDTLLS